MKRKALPILGCFFYILTLSGCWDLVEVDRLSFVTTIGIDIDNQKNTALSIQIPLPQRMLPSSVASSNQQGKKFSIVSVSGKTVSAALNTLQAKTNNELTIEQNKSIIISKQAASRGVEALLKFFINNPKAPPQALVFIAHKHTAREVLSFAPIQETLPGTQFINSAQSAVKYDRTYFISVSQFEARAYHRATDAYAPLIDLDGKEGMYILAGLATFNGFHLAGELDMEEAQMYGLQSGLMRAGNLALKLSDGKVLSLRNVGGKSSIHVKMSRQGLPFFIAKVKVYGTISDLAERGKEITPLDNRRLEQAVQKVLEPKISALIKKLQSYNSDIINFGEEFRVQHLKEWKQYQWKEIFPSVPFKVIVKVKIERNGALR